jgi:hypothetical protein
MTWLATCALRSLPAGQRGETEPEKCVFGVPRDMLLGYIVSQRGIEPNPEKVAALDRMGSIRDLKGV